MSVQTYTVTDSSGRIHGRGLSAYEAATAILTHDGNEYEIRPGADGIGFELWVSRFSRNSGGGNGGFTWGLIYSFEETAEAAEAEIMVKVLKNSHRFGRFGGFSVQTDADYDRETAEIAEEIARWG